MNKATATPLITPPPDPTGGERIFHWILTGCALIGVIALTMVFVATRHLGQASVASDAVNHTQILILDANDLLAQLYASDTTMRAYIASGAPGERSIGRAALNECIDRLASVQSLTRQNPAQSARLSVLDTLVHERINFMRQILDSNTDESRALSTRLIEADAGWYALRQIKTEIDQLRLSALAELSRRDQENYLQAQTTRWTVWTGLALNFLLLGGMALLLRNDLMARRARTAALRSQNTLLEQIIEQRTRALREANAQLQDDILEQTWARLALDHQQHYNQLIINSIREAVFIVTRMQHISRINPAVLHLTGRSAGEIVNRPLHEIIRLPQDVMSDTLNQQLLSAMADGQDLRHQPAILLDRLGQRHEVIVNLFPLRDSGNVVGAVIIIDDPSLYHTHPNQIHFPQSPAQIK